MPPNAGTDAPIPTPASAPRMGRGVRDDHVRSTEEVLRENEEKFRIAFDNAPMGMSIVRPDGSYIDANPALCEMFGYTKEELLSGTVTGITHPDDVERSLRWVRQMIAGDHSQPEFEKRYIHKDGHVVWGLVRAQWVRNSDGSPRLSIVHTLDITDRKRAEQALLARERQLQEAHAIAQMGHWQLELSDGSMSWEASVYRLLEYEGEAVVPSQALFLARAHPDDLPMVEQAYRAAVDRQQPCDLVHRLSFPDGRVKHARWVCRPEFDAAGRTHRVRGILQDVTTMRVAEEERTRLKAQLHQAQKMEAIGYLAGGVAHDFNNLLTAIGGNASLALLEAPEGGGVAESLKEIMAAVDSAADLTRQLLTFSRKQVIAPKIINLNDVVNRLSSMLRRLLGEDLEFTTMLAPDLGQVRMDVAQAEQILVNLAVNARDAMTDGGRLLIQTDNVQLSAADCRDNSQLAPGAYVTLTVSDSGRGMSEATRQRVFEPFFTTKEQGYGTGLGLAIVYGAVQQNGGHIDVQSELGRGSTFRAFLPRVDQPPEDLRPKTMPQTILGTETIVLVEDDDMVRTVAERVLVQQGYRVRSYPNDVVALAALQASDASFDLLITDVIMPGMNGRALAEQVKLLRPNVTVLFASGYTRNVIAQHGVLEEGIQFLPKPYSVESLSTRVREVLSEDP
jgi:two-component system cell cycle sensor histidine kinase/response regulator CckA